MQKNAIFFFVTLAVAIAATTSYLYWQSSETPHEEEAHENQESSPSVTLTPEQIQQMGVEIEPAGPGDLQTNLEARGKIIIHPDRLAHVLPKVSGVAQQATKNVGDFTREGEILAIIESQEIADLKANYLAAQSKEKLASNALEREERLYQKQISAGQDYFNAQNAYEEALINTQLAKQKLEAIGLTEKDIQTMGNLNIYELTAPISGLILNRHITKGEFIEKSQTIYEIADLSAVLVDIALYPQDLAKFKEGHLIQVFLPNGEETQGRILYIKPTIGDETLKASAIAQIDNPDGKWRPGTFVRVKLPVETIAASIAIPKEAVLEIEGQACVFVQKAEGFERRCVQTGREDDKNIEILGGLEPGEHYASKKTFLLKAELGKSSVEDDD